MNKQQEEKHAMFSALLDITNIVGNVKKLDKKEIELLQKELMKWFMGIKKDNKGSDQ